MVHREGEGEREAIILILVISQLEVKLAQEKLSP